MKRTIASRYGISLILFLLMLEVAALSQSPDEKSKARDFVQEREPALQNKTDAAKVPDLRVLAAAAFDAGDLDKAEKFANELQVAGRNLQVAAKDRPFYANKIANALHVSNTVLGLVALEKGRVEAAKDYLLASSKVSDGSGLLTLGGPEMLLAKRLIEKGERETVIRYLDDCAVFWKNDRGKLEKWKGIINNGGMPDFGGNLKSQLNFWKYS